MPQCKKGPSSVGALRGPISYACLENLSVNELDSGRQGKTFDAAPYLLGALLRCDLFEAMRKYTCALSDRSFRGFQERGISREALLGLAEGGRMIVDDYDTSAPNMVSAASIEVTSGAVFDFATDGDAGFVWFALNREGYPCDIVAWIPKSNRMATYLGNASVVGIEQLNHPRVGPLPIHASPMDWLRADRRGLVVIDWLRAASLLALAGPYEVTSEAERRRAKAALTISPKVTLATAVTIEVPE